ncbi:hypothetical protein [Ekhidna sp. To15]|uniref:hypothetical protein n=1 Tax=Ekhidna sp. To15 TaxID=3395267 RepID=UPI003F5213A8
MEIKYNALLIKGWLIQTISPIGWSTLVARAMPELLEVNPKFSAYYIGKSTKWGADEMFVLRWYLLRMYKMDMPEQVLDEATSVNTKLWDLGSFSFMEGTQANFKSIRAQLRNFFKL